MQINSLKLEQIVTAAKAKTTDSRWIKAIDKAHTALIENPYVTLDADGLLVLGSTGNIYHANGTCQCKGFQFNSGICYHRAMARLVARYNETENVSTLSTVDTPNAGVLLKRQPVAHKAGCYDI